MMKYYRCIYHFNASHSMSSNKERIHSHTFTISLSVRDINQPEMFQFKRFELMIQEMLNQYSGRYLNELPEFEGKIPTIETIGDILYEQMKTKLKSEGFWLYQLEVSENPLKEYSVADEILLPMEYLRDCREYWGKIVTKQLQE